MSGAFSLNLSVVCDAVGEDAAAALLDSYRCPQNPDVERFARRSALEFSRQGIARTHLVFADDRGAPALAGFFALANKVLTVRTADVSRTLARRISRFGAVDEEAGTVSVAAPLIAQLGKNFAEGREGLVSGSDLLDLACGMVARVQDAVGGRLVYLECERVGKLVAFYEANGFRQVTPDFGPGRLLKMVKYL